MTKVLVRIRSGPNYWHEFKDGERLTLSEEGGVVTLSASSEKENRLLSAVAVAVLEAIVVEES